MGVMVLGLTGGIASGKSTVARLFAELGAVIVDADQLARDAVAPGTSALAMLVEAFGEQVLTEKGTLDRAKMAEVAFGNPEARRQLEAITHPAIAALAEKRLAELRAGGETLVVYEAPLLFEAGAEKRVDRVLLVLVEPQVQRQRIMARDQLDSGAVEARIAAQWPQADKVLRADYVIDNSGSMQDTRQKVAALFNELTASSRPVRQVP